MIIKKGECDTTTDPLRGSYCVHIAITKLRVLARKDACMVFRIIWHLRCLLLPLFQFSHSFSSEPQFVPSAIVADINHCICCAKGEGRGV